MEEIGNLEDERTAKKAFSSNPGTTIKDCFLAPLRCTLTQKEAGEIKNDDEICHNLISITFDKFPSLEFSHLMISFYLYFRPVVISLVEVMNYSKSPKRGVQTMSILSDSNLIFTGYLPKCKKLTTTTHQPSTMVNKEESGKQLILLSSEISQVSVHHFVKS